MPCFLWIFLGAPYVEQLRENRAIAASLSAITAAVVGVMLNLAAWFAVHVPRPASALSITWCPAGRFAMDYSDTAALARGANQNCDKLSGLRKVLEKGIRWL